MCCIGFPDPWFGLLSPKSSLGLVSPRPFTLTLIRFFIHLWTWFLRVSPWHSNLVPSSLLYLSFLALVALSIHPPLCCVSMYVYVCVRVLCDCGTIGCILFFLVLLFLVAWSIVNAPLRASHFFSTPPQTLTSRTHTKKKCLPPRSHILKVISVLRIEMVFSIKLTPVCGQQKANTRQSE